MDRNDITAFNLNLRGTNAEFKIATDQEFATNLTGLNDTQRSRAMQAREAIKALAPNEQIATHSAKEQTERATIGEPIQNPTTGQKFNALKLNWDQSGGGWRVGVVARSK